jgi:hypothetical protein
MAAEKLRNLVFADEVCHQRNVIQESAATQRRQIEREDLDVALRSQLAQVDKQVSDILDSTRAKSQCTYSGSPKRHSMIPSIIGRE